MWSVGARRWRMTDDATPLSAGLDLLKLGFWPVVTYPRGARIPARHPGGR